MQSEFGKRLYGHSYPRVTAKGHPRSSQGKVLEHILIAERALGKPLPKGAEVHHIDGDGYNNNPGNLMICESHAYHALLHVRRHALDACGDASKRACKVCKQFDAPKNLVFRSFKGGTTGHHNGCFNSHRAKWYAANRVEINERRRLRARSKR